MMARESRPAPTLLYWLVTGGAIVFGMLGAASIGLPLFVLGLVLVARGVQGRPRSEFWAPILGVVLFFVAFQIVGTLWGPLTCSTIYSFSTEIGPGETESTTIIDNTRTTCDSPFLPRRIKGEAPPLWPVILAAVGIGFAGAFLARQALTRLASGKGPRIAESTGTAHSHPSRIPEATFRYWLLTSALIVFGFLGMLSVGFPLLVLGLALAALSDVRHRPASFWPPLAGIALFFATYILFAPLGCSRTATTVGVGTDAGIQPQVGVTTCVRILLPDSSGADEPPAWPVVIAAAGAALVAGAVTRQFLIRRSKDQAAASPPPPGEA